MCACFNIDVPAVMIMIMATEIAILIYVPGTHRDLSLK